MRAQYIPSALTFRNVCCMQISNTTLLTENKSETARSEIMTSVTYVSEAINNEDASHNCVSAGNSGLGKSDYFKNGSKAHE